MGWWEQLRPELSELRDRVVVLTRERDALAAAFARAVEMNVGLRRRLAVSEERRMVVEAEKCVAVAEAEQAFRRLREANGDNPG